MELFGSARLNPSMLVSLWKPCVHWEDPLRARKEAAAAWQLCFT
jgi:hypothetical protein